MIQTDRLIVRPWTEDDVDHLLALSTDIGYNCFSPPGIFLVKDRDEALKKVRERIEKFRMNGTGKFPIFLRATHQFVGTCGVDVYSIHGKNELELGYRLMLQHWGQGYAFEAAKEIMNYSFGTLGWQTIFAFAATQNRASIHLIKKLEFIPAGRIDHRGVQHELYEKPRPF